MGISANQLAQLFIREIQRGISGTDIKAGILKAASDVSGVTGWQETVLQAVARAHLETGVPIMLHSFSPGRVGEQQLAILKDEGVDPGWVKMDHSMTLLILNTLPSFWNRAAILVWTDIQGEV